LEHINDNTVYRYEFVYLKDEIVDGKDCIFIKELRYDANTNELKLLGDETLSVYWIEKSTGFLIGLSDMLPNEDTAVLNTIYKNISFGTVKDSDFEMPIGYTVK